MIKSMTGFGDASVQKDGVYYAVEIRSVNNRYLKTNIRVPEELNRLEPDLVSQLKKTISRGTVSLSIMIRDSTDAAAGVINQGVLQHYLSELETARAAAKDPESVKVDLVQLLHVPGVLTSPDDEQRVERYHDTLMELTCQACEKLNDLRVTEGQGLREDIIYHLRSIREQLDQIIKFAPDVTREYEKRLHDRVNELASKAGLEINSPDLIKEVALYAEKCDIAEEVQRLTAHLAQFHQLMENQNDQPVGRTLDFLSQEILREANTIASKSNNASISQAIVTVKGAIDRVKEQVQNIE